MRWSAPTSPTITGTVCRSRGGEPRRMSANPSQGRRPPMAEAVADPRRQVVQQGLFSKTLSAVAKLILWLMFSLLFSIILEWAGMVLWWPDEGVDHSRTMLVTEISYLDNDFRRSVVTSDPARFAKRFADNSYHYLFEVTRFADFIRWVSLPPRKYEQGVRATLHTVYKPLADADRHGERSEGG
ncbi:MAG: DUF4400 domain-containing protein [Candidatus Thiodiazotropha sp.]